MAIQKTYKLHSVRYEQTSPATIDVVIPAVESIETSIEADIEREIMPQDIYSRSAILRTPNLGSTFATKALKTALDIADLGLGGGCLSDNTTITLYFAQYDCKAILAGANHLSYKIDRGIIVPRTLQANHAADAVLTYGITAVGDSGGNAPFEKSSNVALPTYADTGDRWSMHIAQVNGAAVTAKKSIGIEFGARIETEGADDEVFDTLAMLTSVLPVVTIGGVNPEWFSDGFTGSTGLLIPFEGEKIAHADSSFTLKRRVGGEFNPVNAIEFAFGGPAYFSNPVSGQGVQLATSELRVEPIAIGANDPITIDTTIDLTPP